MENTNKKEVLLTPDVLNGNDFMAKRKYIYEVMETMGIGVGLEKNEKMQFIDLCCMYSLNPLKKEIYITAFDNKSGKRTMSIIVAYQVYLQKANATGLIDIPPTTTILNEFVIDEKGNFVFDSEGKKKKTPLANIICEFKCKRKDQSEIFIKHIRMNEFNKGQSVWLTMPFFMLEKCAIACGLRQLFPLELGTLPYIAEEQWAQAMKEVVPIIKENIETSALISKGETNE